MEEKKVRFSADPGNLGSFMDEMRKKSRAMFDEQLAGAKKVSAEYKDWTKSLKDFINEFQRKSRIENEARKQRINQAEEFGGSKERDWAQGERARMKDDVSQQKQQTEYLKQLLDEFKGEGPPPTKRSSVFTDIIKADLLRGLSDMFRQIPGARTGLEGISGAASITGASTGALIGSLFGKSPQGALLGKAGLGFFGDAMVRHLQEQSRFSGVQGRLRGLGGNTSDLDMSDLGLDKNAAGQLKEGFMKAIGFDPKESMRELVSEMRAFTLDEGTVSNYMGTRRLGSGLVGVNTIARTGQEYGGISKTDISRLVTNQTQLVNMLAQSAVAPNQFNAMKSIMDFNSIGGPFSVSDPRSMELMSTIHSNLVNPSTPFGRAQSYSTLRRLNPNAGLVDLLIQQQRGVENRGLVSGTLEDIAGMGGGEDFQTLTVANRLGLGGNLGAARMLLRDRGKIGKMTDSDFTSYSKQFIEDEAKQNVPRLEQNMAAITNAFIDGMGKGITTVSEKFASEINEAIKEGVKELPDLMSDAFRSGVELLGYQGGSSKQDQLWKKYARQGNTGRH